MVRLATLRLEQEATRRDASPPKVPQAKKNSLETEISKLLI